MFEHTKTIRCRDTLGPSVRKARAYIYSGIKDLNIKTSANLHRAPAIFITTYAPANITKHIFTTLEFSLLSYFYQLTDTRTQCTECSEKKSWIADFTTHHVITGVYWSMAWSPTTTVTYRFRPVDTWVYQWYRYRNHSVSLVLLLCSHYSEMH